MRCERLSTNGFAWGKSYSLKGRNGPRARKKIGLTNEADDERVRANTRLPPPLSGERLTAGLDSGARF
jgi:hypothetical protein